MEGNIGVEPIEVTLNFAAAFGENGRIRTYKPPEATLFDICNKIVLSCHDLLSVLATSFSTFPSKFGG